MWQLRCRVHEIFHGHLRRNSPWVGTFSAKCSVCRTHLVTINVPWACCQFNIPAPSPSYPKPNEKMHCIRYNGDVSAVKNRNIVQFSARLIGITEKPKFENKLKRNDIPESLYIGSSTHISHWIKVLTTGYEITSRQCKEPSCCASVSTQ